MMIAKDLIPDGGLFSLFLSLMFMKLHAENETGMCTLCGGIDPKTFRKWGWPYIESVVELSLTVASKIVATFMLLKWHI